MKPYLWLSLLSTLIFALGWTLHALADRQTPALDSGDRFRQRRTSMTLGPHVGTVKYYLEELALDQAQQESFARIIQDATVEVERREREVRCFLDETKLEIRNLLSLEQRQKLDRILDQKWQKYRDQRFRKTREWLENQASIDPDTRARVLEIIRRYDKSMPKGFRWSAESSPPDAEARWQQRLESRAERNRDLGELLSPEDLERFLEWRSQRSFRHSWNTSRGGDRSP